MRVKKIILLTLMLCAVFDAAAQRCVEMSDSVRLSINERRANRGLVDRDNVFVPKGQWIFGGTASYSTHTNKEYKALIIEGINSNGYTFKVSPLIAYAVSDNMALGARVNYGRTFMRMDEAGLSFGDAETGTNINVTDYYALKHSYSVAAVWRQYIPLGRNKRFAIFNEVQLAGGGSQSKYAADTPVRGTFSEYVDVSLGISPGVVAFVSNVMAVEVNVGVMGVQYSRTKQVHNQVETGKTTSSYMNFSVNLFSIGLGVSFYL